MTNACDYDTFFSIFPAIWFYQIDLIQDQIVWPAYLTDAGLNLVHR